MKITRLFNEFFESERSAGLLLIVCTIISLMLANSPAGKTYIHFWHTSLAGQTVEHWINDGLMAVFFLLIGLELERELYIGELSSFKKASLPVVAAMGGMLVPAGLFLLFNYGTPSRTGAGIPMATDIAFAIGVLSLLGKRVPATLKILLTAIAVIDDLGAIAVIAFFYTRDLAWGDLGIAVGSWGLLLVLNRLKVHNLIPYLAGGLVMWYFMLHSGVHPTITGVLLAFSIPFGHGSNHSASYKLQHFLHKPVAFIILPLFALANTCVIIGNSWYEGMLSSESLGIITGLVLGKPLGIVLFSFLFVAAGICTLPKGIGWKQVGGIGMLGGIGFTMSIFITLLAYSDPEEISRAKIAILLASLVAGTLGYLWLRRLLTSRQP